MEKTESLNNFDGLDSLVLSLDKAIKEGDLDGIESIKGELVSSIADIENGDILQNLASLIMFNISDSEIKSFLYVHIIYCVSKVGNQILPTRINDLLMVNSLSVDSIMKDSRFEHPILGKTINVSNPRFEADISNELENLESLIFSLEEKIKGGDIAQILIAREEVINVINEIKDVNLLMNLSGFILNSISDNKVKSFLLYYIIPFIKISSERRIPNNVLNAMDIMEISYEK